MELHKPIILIGLMGCGKSAIGKRLATALGVPFSDSDNIIEEKMQCSISDIFANQGEVFFRQKEVEIVTDLLKQPPHVIATGGGAFITPTIREAISQYGTSIWLKASFNILFERVSKKNHRPLLENKDKAGTLKRLMDERYPIYEQADHIIESTHSPHKTVVEAILNALTSEHIVE